MTEEEIVYCNVYKKTPDRICYGTVYDKLGSHDLIHDAILATYEYIRRKNIQPEPDHLRALFLRNIKFTRNSGKDPRRARVKYKTIPIEENEDLLSYLIGESIDISKSPVTKMLDMGYSFKEISDKSKLKSRDVLALLKKELHNICSDNDISIKNRPIKLKGSNGLKTYIKRGITVDNKEGKFYFKDLGDAVKNTGESEKTIRRSIKAKIKTKRGNFFSYNMDYKELLDEALRKNVSIQAKLGIDSTKEELEIARRQQYKNLLFLKDVDRERFNAITKNFETKYRKFEIQDSEEVNEE